MNDKELCKKCLYYDDFCCQNNKTICVNNSEYIDAEMVIDAIKKLIAADVQLRRKNGRCYRMTKNEICRMCLEYSTDMTCEHIRECKLMKVLDENKRLKEKVRKLESEKSWNASPERMGR